MDPTQEYTAELLSVAEMFYANNIPLRFVSESPCMGFATLFIYSTYLFDKRMFGPLFSVSLCYIFSQFITNNFCCAAQVKTKFTEGNQRIRIYNTAGIFSGIVSLKARLI